MIGCQVVDVNRMIGRYDLMNDHEASIEDLSYKIIGLVHVSRMYIEFGCPDEDIIEQLHHAAFVLAERTVLEN